MDRSKMPSPALILSIIALFVALSGGAYAALGVHSVGKKQLKANAVTSKKIKPGAVTKRKLAAGALGPQVVAYATVDHKGRLDPSRSRGITQENVSGGYPSAICIGGEGVPRYRSAIVTPIQTNGLPPFDQGAVWANIQMGDKADCIYDPSARLQINTGVQPASSDQDPYPHASQQAFSVALVK